MNKANIFWVCENYDGTKKKTREEGEKLGKKLAHDFFESLAKSEQKSKNTIYDLFAGLIDIHIDSTYLDGQIAGFSTEITKMLAANIFFNGTPEQ
ncbi:hypothetical protein RAM19_05920 [Bartonella apihabitans]|nr:hypothetical protein [Bartonella apihabitans]WLT09667.1 hypothetical protein RAM19_05920 [Bartonella apihabitans]